MTYSIIARCPETGAFGGAIATSNLAVGARCLRLAHGAGAFLSQHRTDPRLGDVGLAALARGDSAEAAVAAAVEAGGAGIGWRQLGALDAEGRAAAHHGARIYSIHSHAEADGALALGNILGHPDVPAAMARAFSGADGPLAGRLMRALEAGRDAGGEVGGPVRSAALRVTGPDGLDERDLRVDIAAEAVAELRALLEAHAPAVAQQRALALEPEAHPVSRALFEGSVRRIAELGLEARFPTAARADRWTVGG
jgi:uncharacterized Ntn-hydrolase superfamily protein